AEGDGRSRCGAGPERRPAAERRSRGRSPDRRSPGDRAGHGGPGVVTAPAGAEAAGAPAPAVGRGDDSNSIEVEGLVREFKGGFRAVDGLDLHVDPGEIYGFLGPNGAGKSTTVHMLTTLLPPTAGTATVAGYDVVHDGPAVRKVIGAALQEAALDP